jgi:hypothetical protein
MRMLLEGCKFKGRVVTIAGYGAATRRKVRLMPFHVAFDNYLDANDILDIEHPITFFVPTSSSELICPILPR